jgi:predicted RNA-binding protein YlxR (DUF448 family)
MANTHIAKAKKKAPLSSSNKSAVMQQANVFIETYLKPNFIQPPPENKNFNYIVDIFSKWHGRYFYICAKYACPSPNAILPFFEIGFARLEYISANRYNLSYMRHNRQWEYVLFDLSLEECFNMIQSIPCFQP